MELPLERVDQRQSSQAFPLKEKIRDYYEVTKPNVISLLAFTAIATVVIVEGPRTNLFLLLLVGVSVWLGSAGANTLGSYFDRDIDSRMGRTRRRPIPTGKISPGRALVFGLALGAAAVGLSSVLTPLSGVFMLIGILDYVVVYSILLKRRTWLNIILGGFSGMMPVFVAYAASFSPYFTNYSFKPWGSILLMGGLVFLWIPSHIWSLALRYRKEYEDAAVPMLPVVFGERNSVRAIALTSLITVLFSFVLWFYGGFGFYYLVFSLVFGCGMLFLNFWLIHAPTSQNAWKVFKYSSPYLALLFIAMMIDSLL